jgi:dihydrolipoamide dehydrogenase
VVIGAGPAGEVLAGRVAQRSDKRVAIVERELIGGECSFYACMPSKALLRPPELLTETGRVPGVAEAVTGDLGVEAVLARRDEVIHDLDDSGQLPWLEDNGIELFRGEARLEGERRVKVGDDVLVAHDAVVIAVGSGALFPPIPGLKDVGAWSNREITTAKEVPQRLIVLGGGVVGVEMAAAWGALGSSVEVIEAVPQLLSREEPFAAEQVQDALEARGVNVHLGAKATEVRRDGDTITVTLEGGESVTGDRLLVAIGRKPHTDDLGLEQFGLSAGEYIEVDDRQQVPGIPWMYAIGDVNGRSLLTHSGKYQARIAADHILGDDGVASGDGPGAPRVVFTDPQVAAVGLTLAQARERGINAVSIDLVTSGSAGASFIGRNAPGTTRFVVDADRDVLVGVTFVGVEVADFLQAATIAVVAEVPLSTLAHAVPPFPTRSELWLKFLEAWEKERGVTVHAGQGARGWAGANR